jgi:hypothetical protein
MSLWSQEMAEYTGGELTNKKAARKGGKFIEHVGWL